VKPLEKCQHVCVLMQLVVTFYQIFKRISMGNLPKQANVTPPGASGASGRVRELYETRCLGVSVSFEDWVAMLSDYDSRALWRSGGILLSLRIRHFQSHASYRALKTI
jgi:hypothetical protein